MNNNKKHYRIYDEKLELLYEIKLKDSEKRNDRHLINLLKRSRLFLNIDDTFCYRIYPKI